MKAISLLQPWASLIAVAEKRWETRSWSTSYRGEIAIHASKGYGDGGKEGFRLLCLEEPFTSVLKSNPLLRLAYTIEARAEVQAVAYQTSGNCGAWETGDQVAALTTGTDPNQRVVAFSSKDYGADAGDLSPTLRSMGHDGSHANGGGQVAVAFNIHSQNSCAMRGAGPSLAALETRVSRCLDGAGFTEQQGGTVALGPKSAVRRLTPRECERLQGFPDDYTAITVRGKPAADGPRYKALGNSMAVPVIRWIGERIEMVAKL